MSDVSGYLVVSAKGVVSGYHVQIDTRLSLSSLFFVGGMGEPGNNATLMQFVNT